jgi:hypothetical protein
MWSEAVTHKQQLPNNRTNFIWHAVPCELLELGNIDRVAIVAVEHTDEALPSALGTDTPLPLDSGAETTSAGRVARRRRAGCAGR